MLDRIVSVSVVCLVLALNGWERDEIRTQDGRQPPTWLGMTRDQQEEADGDPWFIQLPEFIGCCYGDEDSCQWWGFRLTICPHAEENQPYGFIEALVALKQMIDELPISNSIWLIISWTPFLVSLIYGRVKKDWKGPKVFRRFIRRHFKGDVTGDDPGDDLDYPGSEGDKRMWARHREEIEIMAKTIEYVQRKKRTDKRKRKHNDYRVISPAMAPPDCVDKDPLVHPGTVHDPSLQTPGSIISEEDMYPDVNFNQSEFIEPEYEWD